MSICGIDLVVKTRSNLIIKIEEPSIALNAENHAVKVYVDYLGVL